jgi:hypothetical protein
MRRRDKESIDRLVESAGGRHIVKFFRVALIFALMLTSKTTIGEKPASRPETLSGPVALTSSPQFFQIFIFPDKALFVTREEDPFLISVEALCGPGVPDTAQFELLAPTPDFVKIRHTSRALAEALALIEVWPGRGDAGKYTIRFRAINCGGNGGIFTLMVKVKQG